MLDWATGCSVSRSHNGCSLRQTVATVAIAITIDNANGNTNSNANSITKTNNILEYFLCCNTPGNSGWIWVLFAPYCIQWVGDMAGAGTMVGNKPGTVGEG